MPGKADDTGRARLKHLNDHPASQSELFQTMDLVHPANQLVNLGNFASRQKMQWNDVGHGSFRGNSGMRLYLNNKIISWGKPTRNDQPPCPQKRYGPPLEAKLCRRQRLQAAKTALIVCDSAKFKMPDNQR